ncbi:DUF6578 domain-containing protein [Nocardioides aurantiacus]|nr:DUF6578 domain-containing protein [Nocardioides aurantiacus]
MLVWVEAWQMQCCGKKFRAGRDVTWNLHEHPDVDWLVPAIGKELAAQVDRQEDHHDAPDGAPVTSATVRRIRAMSIKYAPSPDDSEVPIPIPGSARIVDVGKADGWYPEAERRGLSFEGYLVDIDVHH